jgi:4-alpha-glucanotransferase
MLDSLLDQLARLRGIGDRYYDYRGELKTVGAASKTAILAAMGCRVTDAEAVAGEIGRIEAGRWQGLLPSVCVVRPGASGVSVVVPADALEGEVRWSVRLDDGSARSGACRAADLGETERQHIDGRSLTRRTLALPEDLPSGYHELELTTPDGERGGCSLIVAANHCHEPDALADGGRLWGVAVQLYTLRSEANWGMGDFADLESVLRQAAANGAAFVGLNPLHALFPSNPHHFSPYSPSSRHFLNVLYIAVPKLPEFDECAEAQAMVGRPEFAAEIARLRATSTVDYPGVSRLKLPVLRLLFRHFRDEHLAQDSARARAFREFRKERGVPLRLHALHDALDERLRGDDPGRWGWPVWPEQYRRPDDPAVAEWELGNAELVDFHAWLQWLADTQLAEAQRVALGEGMAIGLYGDYAVGVNPSGSETWSEQKVYRNGAGVGAPPDALALKGQDWGIPPQDPYELQAAAYRPFRNLIAANMRHFGALRLDHVMALFRQWWVPVGLDATEGGYVHYPLEDLMSVLALESTLNRCLVVGEDLGTVPDEMRHAMAAFSVYHYKVLLFEKHGDGRFRSPEEYLRRSIATITTHDLPTLRGYWEGRDLELRDRLQLYPNEEIRRHVLEERVRDRAQLLAALGAAGLAPGAPSSPDGPYTDALAHATQLYLGRSAAALAVLQAEDLVGMTDPVNVPGTRDEHANWQRKMTASIDEIFTRDTARALFADMCQARPG